ncbi:MAG: N-acetylmuramic acid 6-phosphate etherase [Alphaproteobacteria bacterium]|nr:N-acetylmuramic acid 6-phosphate etherase [Alphaproteobacteria bacterium]
MSTEDISPRYLELDAWPTAEQVRALYEGQLSAVAALGAALPSISLVVDRAVERLRRDGRIIYAGAGTSARIGVQDGAELLPTFNWPSERIAFAIAGGEGALLRAVENAEDSGADGASRIGALGVGPDDVVIGVAASGATLFTVSVLEAARTRGALTVGIASNPGSRLLAVCDQPVLIETGEEPIAGSTRLKAGTAQKVALNLISTTVMIQLGHVYRGMMVDMRPTNEKLRKRSVEMVIQIAGCTPEAAGKALAVSGGNIKTAVLVAHGIDLDTAVSLMSKHDGNLRAALDAIKAG